MFEDYDEFVHVNTKITLLPIYDGFLDFHFSFNISHVIAGNYQLFDKL